MLGNCSTELIREERRGERSNKQEGSMNAGRTKHILWYDQKY
jgi:hypothetical protein